METETYTNVYTLVKALSGNTSFTSEEDTLVNSFINRRIYDAYRKFERWPRYLKLGEARAATDGVIPFTQETLSNVDTFLRIYAEEPYLTNSVREFDFVVTVDGAQVIGEYDDATTFYVDYKKRLDGPFNNTTNTAIPIEFSKYAAYGAYADFLRYDEQHAKAQVEDANAEQYLLLELRSAMAQSNNRNAGMRIRSHHTAQSR